MSRCSLRAALLATSVFFLAAPSLAQNDPGTTAPPQRSAPPEVVRPPPLHVEYAQYGVALTANVLLADVKVGKGTDCGPPSAEGPQRPPCILGSGGGLVIRGGYRSPGPWYVGGAYEFTKMDSSNLYRLGIFQQARVEFRYVPDVGYRTTPYFTWGLGGLAYGNEWGAETGGALIFGGGGLEVEVSRLAVLGIAFVYRPALIVGWKDTAGVDRPTSVAQFLGIEFRLEVRTELGRR